MLLQSSLLQIAAFSLVLAGVFSAHAEAALQQSEADYLNAGKALLQTSYSAIGGVDAANKIAKAAEKQACDLLNTKGTPAAARATDIARQLASQAKALDLQMKLKAKRAYEMFVKAASTDSKNPVPLGYEGLSALQYGDYCLAAVKIDQAFALGYSDPVQILHFARAEATVQNPNATTEDLSKGATEVDQYISFLQTYTGGGSTASWLAEAHKIKKFIADSLTAKDLALCISRWNQSYPNLKKKTCPVIPPERELPFTLSLLSGVGYNDNLLTLARNSPLPAGVSNKDAVFNESSVSLNRDFTFQHPYNGQVSSPACSSDKDSTPWLGTLVDTLSLLYLATWDTYDDFSAKDSFLQTFSLSYRHTFTPWVSSGMKLSDQPLFTSNTLVDNLATGQMFLTVSPNALLNSQISYFLIRNDGYSPTTAESNPNGFTHRAEFVQTAVLRQDPVDLSPALTAIATYGHEWTNTEGFKGRIGLNDLVGKIQWDHHVHDECSFIRGYSIAFSDEFKPDRYRHAYPESASSTAILHRDDDKNTAVLSLSVRMLYDPLLVGSGLVDNNRLEATLQYRFSTDRSNESSKTYDQNYVLASLKINF